MIILIKDEFNKLEIIDQINYVNKNLNDGFSLTVLCENVGISRSTIRTRFAKQGYNFDKISNQYIQDNEDTSGRAYSKLTVSNRLTDDKSNFVSGDLTNNNIENNALMLNNTDSDSLTYLLRNIDILKDFIESSKKTCATNEVNSIEDIINDIYKFKQDKRNYKVKSLRIDSDILSDFESIANNLSSKGINQQEFLNYVLKSYIDFYKSFN